MRSLLTTTALIAAAAAAPTTSSAASSSAPTVTVKNGTYYGVHSEQFNQDFFLGMPFAAPPVGDLRFTVPQTYNESWDGERNATEYGWACIGDGVSYFSIPDHNWVRC